MLTELDKKILAALKQDGRASWASLARRFSVSRVTIQNRVESMRVRKIIRGYTVIADPDSMRTAAFGEKAFLLVRFAPGASVFQLQKLLSVWPGVLGVWGVTGKWDCLALIRAVSLQQMAELREHIVNKIKISRLETYPVLDDFAPVFHGGEVHPSSAD
ncbi:MAG: Lrp/AsnC family transcriptional regulator [Gammaproteobacteria bacterium]|nr:Lrp/AsnC family transcriptional regulator [Gammaproteobacteria bacterium]